MKVTFIEEIEQHNAWFQNMYCSKCDSGKYSIHHQLQPEMSECWWVECSECGRKSAAFPARKLAIKNWKKDSISTL